MSNPTDDTELPPKERQRLLQAVVAGRAARNRAQEDLEVAVHAAWMAGLGPTEISRVVGLTNRAWVYRVLHKFGVDTSAQ